MRQDTNDAKSERDRLEEKFRLLKSLDYKNSEQSLKHFIRACFPVLEPGVKFLDNWHLDYVSEHLEMVSRGTLKNLIINIPPGTMKSLIVTVCWPVWTWLEWAESRWLFSSYSSELSTYHSLKRRRLIRSDWFQSQWSNKFTLQDDQDRKMAFENTVGGSFIATSSGGTVGGKHGDFIVLDDPQNPEKDMSDTDRETANSHVEYMVTTRRRSAKQSKVVLVMQRLHHNDATFKLLDIQEKIGTELNDFALISIESVFRQKKVFSFPISKKKRNVDSGELLWPNRYGKKELENLQNQLGSYRYNSQFLQMPTPPGGGVIKRSWWQYYREIPTIKQSAWFWDTAVKEKQMNDYSVGILAATTERGLVIMDMVRKKLAYPELKIEVRARFNATPATFIVIEDKSSGQQLVQEFRQSESFAVLPFKPEGDKFQRASLVSPIVEAGKVYLPQNAPWLADFLNEWEQFPKGAHDDIVDATVMAITHFYLKQNVGSFSTIRKQDPRYVKTLAGSLRSKPRW